MLFICPMIRTFEVSTTVQSSIEKIQQNFTAQLLLQLNPPFPPVKLLVYEGNHKGAEVVLELNLLLFKQKWKSKIVDELRTADTWYFVDEGISLPFFLSAWKHLHLVEKTGETARITDRISLQGPSWLPDFILVILFKTLMKYRRPIYQRVFGKALNSAIKK